MLFDFINRKLKTPEIISELIKVINGNVSLIYLIYHLPRKIHYFL